jgi:hypothetical protein
MNLAEDYLTQRGISLDTAVKYGIEFDKRVSSKVAQERLGRGWPKGEVNEVLWFPVYDLNENIVSWIARPLPNNSLLPRFVCPNGSDGPPLIFKEVWDARRATDQDVLITEGPPKGLVLRQAGALPIALNGVWMAVSKNGNGKYGLRQELLQFQWLGRRVYLCFDADQNKDQDVLRALIRTAFAFNAVGAQIFQLTTWSTAEGKGIDDFLAGKAGTDPDKQKECLDILIAAAQPFFTTLRPFMLSLVEKELGRLAMSPAQRAQLCKLLADPLKVRAAALEGSFSFSELPPEKKGRLQETIEPWPDPVNGAELLQEIFGQLQRFFIVDDNGYAVICLHVVLAYCWDLFFKLPILRLKSPEKRCGKSTALDVIERLVVRPLLTVSVSPAGLYRIIEKFHPYVIVDEADSFGKENDELRVIVNGGYERGRPAIRINKETLEPEFFDTFGCKVLASIGPLHETNEDRSIIINMQRKSRGIEVEELCDVAPEIFVDLRRKIVRWVIDNRDKIQSTRLARPKSLVDRVWNKWRPLLTIAHVVGGIWPAECLKAAIAIAGASDEERSTRIEVLIRIRAASKKKDKVIKAGKDQADFLPTDEIITHLNSDKEAPWADWQKGDQKGITTKKLSGLLKPFGIKSVYPRTVGGRSHGYWLKDFKESFESYLPAEDEPEKEPEDDED